MKNYGLIGFDMDGTLCHPVISFDEIFERAFGIRKSAVEGVWMGALQAEGARTGIEAIRAIFPDLGEVRVEEYLHEFSHLWAGNLKLFGGVVAMLEGLKASGVKLTLITNGPSVMQHVVIDCLGIRDCFDMAFATGDEVLGVNKPNRACFDRVAQLMDVEADDCLFIGDGEVNDYRGAQSAGWDALWVKVSDDQNQSKFGDLIVSGDQKTPYTVSWS
ncbi:MAG: HAD family hydrolase [Alphaproteobacteria bacterium]|nr:HAD family hydrolase [Alphaproteobacteria bacterium]